MLVNVAEKGQELPDPHDAEARSLGMSWALYTVGEVGDAGITLYRPSHHDE